MAAAFDCPKCGAPLVFEPHPGDETVECTYCHETVIIPRDMRIKAPRVVVQRQSSPNRAQVITIAVIGVVAVACIAILIFSNPEKPSTADLSADPTSYDASISTSPTLSAGDRATAAAETQATLAALQPILLVEQNWPASLTEPFADNSRKWRTGDVRDSYITGNRSIINGIYIWKITSVKSASDFSLPDMPDQQDFYASVNMNLVSMPDDPDADAGLFFRYNSTNRTWYYFSVNDKGQYYFGWFNGTDWYSLIPETDSSAIHIGQTNRLTVGAQGSQFIFLINGQMVDHFIDDSLKSGTIGVGINLPQADEKATVEFSNFTVLSPAPKP